MKQLPLGVSLPDRAVFASFLPAGNAEALQHAGRIAAGEPGLTWLCGATGAGKTHLLQAICAQAGQSHRTGLVPLGELGALGPDVLQGVAELDCLCVDDLETVVGDLSWERALFTVLRECAERGGSLVLAARSPPALLPWALADLGSRCAAAAIFPLRPLDDGERRQALQLRARLRGLDLPADTLRWLERRFARDTRRLFELLDTLDEASLAAQRRLTVPFIRDVLARSAGTVG